LLEAPIELDLEFGSLLDLDNLPVEL